MKPKRLRFWIHWKESIVRLTIADGQTITLEEGGPTDEGHSYRSETYTFEDGILTLSCIDSGSDCDGRLDYFSEQWWKPGMDTTPCKGIANDGSVFDMPEERPYWQTKSAHQRDYYAEAAGY